jgi:hypothetical protein
MCRPYLGSTIRYIHSEFWTATKMFTVTWFEGGLIIPKYILHREQNLYLMYLIIDVEAILECPSPSGKEV